MITYLQNAYVEIMQISYYSDRIILSYKESTRFTGTTLVFWRPFEGWVSFFGIMSQCDPTLDLLINVGLRDLYFMVQRFCPIFWRLFDEWTSSFGIMSQCDTKIVCLINIGHSDLYFFEPVLLLHTCILKIVSWMNVILWDIKSV